VLQIVREGTVTCADGTILPMQCASVCVHGDNEAALSAVSLIRTGLEQAGIQVCPMKELIK